MKRLVPTAEMTLGPFFPPEFARGLNDLAPDAGDAIEITGRVTELDGKPLDNLVLEIWQADPAGRLDNPDFAGWGRAATNAQGEYRFRTVRPGAVPGRAPHINFLILYSGLMRQLQTVMFFEKSDDPVLQSVEPSRRSLLLANAMTNRSFRFDLRLRGDDETPFFDD
ncbi:MAG TPA: protocatechuate 3,4-dioxygenase subunit alpha [Burkholderiales bacterium]|nr:protocatechuate 3,4-dioxygenase subunit alpha [Burkholderiales bacterium]